MNPLLARAALAASPRRVHAEERGGDMVQGSPLFAVYAGEPAGFVGLVTSRAAMRFPHRIFADLLGVEPQGAVHGNDSAQEVVRALDATAAEALAVIEQDGTLLGAITRASVLDALLREERRLHDDLRADEQRLRALFQAMPDRVFVFDPDGRSRDDVPQNSAGVGLDGLKGHSLDDVLPAESAEAVRKIISASLSLGTVQTASVRVGEREHELRVARLDGASVLCVARDTTELTQLKARLVFADRMVAMGTLAAGVAHEINNPLAYVMASVDLLKSTLVTFETRPESRVEASARLTDIEEGLVRIQTIVRDLRGLARGDQTAPVGPVDMEHVLRSAINMVMPHIRPRARLVMRFQRSCAVMASEARLGQVFMNLLINAAHAIPEGAPEKNQIEVRLYDEAGEVHVIVSDSGVGLSPQARARLFEAFFTTKGPDQGSGLGLFISNNIVQELNGRMLVEDGIDSGCAFHVVLPMTARAVKRPAAPLETAGAAPTQPSRVLAVDDEPAMLALLPSLLRPHAVTTALSGSAAMKILDSGAVFDVVLCDLMMPGMTGMDLYREACVRWPALSDRFVFMTGGTYTEASNTFVETTQNPVVEKPFDLATLRRVVNHALHPTDAPAA